MNESLKPAAAGVLILVVFFVLVGTVRRGCVSEERYALADAKVDEALATRFAQAVAENQEPGEVVLVRFSGYIPATEEIQKVKVDAFKRALPRGYEVAELPPASLSQEAHGNWVVRTSGGNWGADLLEWMRGHTNAVAVVSLVGVPNLSPEQWKGFPPFYSVEMAEEPYHRQLLERGYLKGLAVMREDADAVAIRGFSGSKDKLFDMAYEYRTATAP